ncbi:unnamed protein product [Clavelina lepadiformis]|uniref:Uncharacterized protein n=1 Tax=Clavelina lepadiformis TaxID=159417 RepID=A0ABP0FT15_CLALP
MAADKKVLMAMFMKMQEDVLKFIPENERPDITDLVEFGGQQFLNPKVTECKGYRSPPPFSAETVEWQFVERTFWSLLIRKQVIAKAS